MTRKNFSEDKKFYTRSRKFEALPFLRNLNKKLKTCKNKFCKIVFCKYVFLYLASLQLTYFLWEIFSRMRSCIMLSNYLPFWVRGRGDLTINHVLYFQIFSGKLLDFALWDQEILRFIWDLDVEILKIDWIKLPW